MSRQVHFPGHGRFWLFEEGSLAPLEHCNENGELIVQFPVPNSFAHVFDNGEIKRHGKVIGHISDLEDVPC